MNENNTNDFPAGFYVDRPKEGTPAFVKARVSIQTERAIDWLKRNTNEKGYCNLDLLSAKESNKLYFKLNNFQPKQEEKPEDIDPFK